MNGNHEAFPRMGTSANSGARGMTYRQWLIGQALNGLLAKGQYATAAVDAIGAADNTIKLMKDREICE
jgi:hypothetical protein